MAVPSPLLGCFQDRDKNEYENTNLTIWVLVLALVNGCVISMNFSFFILKKNPRWIRWFPNRLASINQHVDRKTGFRSQRQKFRHKDSQHKFLKIRKN